MFLLFLAACPALGDDDTGDTADEEVVSPLAGPWSGTISAAWVFPDELAVEFDSEATIWLDSSHESTYGWLHLWGTTSSEGHSDRIVRGAILLRLETPTVLGAQPLVREYGYGSSDEEPDPCAYVDGADAAHFACPFAFGDRWFWDGADGIEQRHETGAGDSALTLRRAR